MVTAELDIVRDEGEAYARKWMTAGVPVAATRYLGTIHAFMLLNPLCSNAGDSRRYRAGGSSAPRSIGVRARNLAAGDGA